MSATTLRASAEGCTSAWQSVRATGDVAIVRPADTSGWRVVPLEDQSEWEAALDGVPHGLAHTWGYNKAMQATSGHRTSLFVADSGEDRFLCPLAERESLGSTDVYTPLGFSGIIGRGSLHVLRESWTACAAQHDWVAGYVGLHPVLAPEGLPTADDAHSANSVYLLDPTIGADALLAQMSESTRRRLRRFAPDETRITSDRDKCSKAFLQLYGPFMRTRQAGSPYALSDETLHELCGLPEVTLLGFPAERPRAVVMMGSAGYGAEYVFGVADPDDRGYILPLLWRAIRDDATAGNPWLNLGGGIREDDSLAEFKRRLGGRRVPLVSLQQIYDAGAYRALCEVAGTDSGYFPAYRSRSSSSPRPATLE